MISASLLVVQGILPLLSLYLMKQVIDAVTAGMTAANKQAAWESVIGLVTLSGGIALVSALCRSLATLVSEAQGQVVTDFVQGILYAKSIEIDLEYYENSQYYDKLHRAQREAPYRPTRIVTGLVQGAQNGVSLLAIASLIVSFDWVIALILFLAALPGVAVRFRYANQLFRWQQKRTSTERRAWYFGSMMSGDTHAKEIRLFNLGQLFTHRFHELRQQIRRERFAIASQRSMEQLVTQATVTIAMFGSFGFMVHQTVQGRFTIGDLVMYYQAFQRGQEALQGLLMNLAGLYEDNLFLSQLYEFLDLKPKVVEPAHPKSIPHPMRNGIVFENVSFQYATSSRTALTDISLTIRPGEVVALVGGNGSGKTTLTKLLCRLYDPTVGRILLDGIDLRQFATTDLRQEISVVFQDYAKYHLSATENIWFGNISLPQDSEQILAAARQVGADDVITKLPNGYETILGKWFETGEELSIGQWQKIALARAFLRNAQVVILDEPTSALDAKAEYEVFHHFRQLLQGRTAILISHRLSTIKMADQIYVLEGGQLVERGTHDELMVRCGTYAHLFETQAQQYR
jgi:ATP-binding cassette subfamily B protein